MFISQNFMGLVLAHTKVFALARLWKVVALFTAIEDAEFA